MKRAVKARLSPDALARATAIRTHARGLLSAARSGHRPQVDSRATFETSIATFQELLTRLRDATDSRQRDELLKQAMQWVTLNDVGGSLVDTTYIANLVRDDSLTGYLRAAGFYSSGEVREALALLDQLCANAPTPLAFLLASRCLSHGLGDMAEAATRLEAGMGHSTTDAALELAYGAALYWQGKVSDANDVLASMGGRLANFVGASADALRLQAEVDQAIHSRLLVRPKGDDQDVYTEESAAAYWRRLWGHMVGLNRFQHGWPGLRWLYEQQIGAAIQRDPNIRRVVNFGVFCAVPDASLANRFPDVEFIGVDREVSVRQLNEHSFAEQNLRFLAADVLEVLPELTKGDGATLLFHARTATLCYPAFLELLYRSCAEAGVDYIALWENNSLDRKALRFHEFGQFPAVSVPYKDVMFLHDYGRLLTAAGYDVITAQVRPSNFDLVDDEALNADGHVAMLTQLRG